MKRSSKTSKKLLFVCYLLPSNSCSSLRKLLTQHFLPKITFILTFDNIKNIKQQDSQKRIGNVREACMFHGHFLFFAANLAVWCFCSHQKYTDFTLVSKNLNGPTITSKPGFSPGIFRVWWFWLLSLYEGKTLCLPHLCSDIALGAKECSQISKGFGGTPCPLRGREPWKPRRGIHKTGSFFLDGNRNRWSRALPSNPSRALFVQAIFYISHSFWPVVPEEDGTSCILYLNYTLLRSLESVPYIEVDRLRRKVWDYLE